MTLRTPISAPDWNRIDHVLLDMDGTILDLAFDNYFWSQLVPQRYAELHGLEAEAAFADLEERLAAVQHTLPWYCLDHWSRETGLNLADLKREVREHIRPLEGAVDFLHEVRESGRQLWLVTNAHRDSWQLKMEHTGLQPMFDIIISSHDFGAPKEDPRFWERLQVQHLFDPSRALFADDSLPVLRAARGHGLANIVAIRQPDTRRPSREIADFYAVDGLRSLLPVPLHRRG